MSKVILILLGLVFATNAQDSNKTKQFYAQDNQEVIKTLDANNSSQQAVKQNKTGSDISEPWRNAMKSFGVKQATATVGFDYQGQELKLSLQEMTFGSRYNYFGADAEIKNTNPEIKTLNEKLKIPFFNKALELIDTLKIENNSCGKLYLQLFDDASMPIVYNTSTVEFGCSPKVLLN